eukprot:SAG11_NODE_2486_length_3303_cov_1.852060_1_plen_268_part_10
MDAMQPRYSSEESKWGNIAAHLRIAVHQYYEEQGHEGGFTMVDTVDREPLRLEINGYPIALPAFCTHYTEEDLKKCSYGEIKCPAEFDVLHGTDVADAPAIAAEDIFIARGRRRRPLLVNAALVTAAPEQQGILAAPAQRGGRANIVNGERVFLPNDTLLTDQAVQSELNALKFGKLLLGVERLLRTDKVHWARVLDLRHLVQQMLLRNWDSITPGTNTVHIKAESWVDGTTIGGKPTMALLWTLRPRDGDMNATMQHRYLKPRIGFL